MVQGLTAEDLVMDSYAGGLMDHLLGAKLPAVVGALRAEARGKKISDAKGAPKQLKTYVEDVEERLFAGIGAALLLKRAGGSRWR